jgi:hypothetical protein
MVSPNRHAEPARYHTSIEDRDGCTAVIRCTCIEDLCLRCGIGTPICVEPLSCAWKPTHTFQRISPRVIASDIDSAGATCGGYLRWRYSKTKQLARMFVAIRQGTGDPMTPSPMQSQVNACARLAVVLRLPDASCIVTRVGRRALPRSQHAYYKAAISLRCVYLGLAVEALLCAIVRA